MAARRGGTGEKSDPGSYARSLAGVRVGWFVIKDYLGHGGFGVVLRAYDEELDREVALKIPRPELLRQSELNRRMLDEARAAAKLRHPGIVQVHEVGSLGPVIYIASELCEGKLSDPGSANRQSACRRALLLRS